MATASSDDPAWCSDNTVSSSSVQIETIRPVAPFFRSSRHRSACTTKLSAATSAAFLAGALATGIPLAVVIAVGAPTTPSHTTASAEWTRVNWNAEELQTWCSGALDEAQKVVDALSQRLVEAPHTKASVLDAINDLDLKTGVGALAGLLAVVHPQKDVRDAATACELSVGKFDTATYLNRSVYESIRSVRDERAVDALAERRYARALEAFERSGIGLATPQLRALAQNLSDTLDELSTEFEQRLASDTRRVSIPSGDAASLSGLDAAFIAEHTTQDGSAVVITTNYPDLAHVYRHGNSESLRRDLYD